MAGTDKTKFDEAAELLPTLGAPPAVILCEPQLGENIGMCARVMLNFGLTEMRIVNPRDGWPNPAAEGPSSGATEVLENAKVYESFDDAIADLNHVYATTARQRDLRKPVYSPRMAAAEIRKLNPAYGQPTKTGILFGRERWGLHNDEVSKADAIITYPVNPAFASLNLAQAVLLMAYEWFAGGADQAPVEIPQSREGRASKEDMTRLFDHLEDALTDSGFLAPPEKKPGMVRNLRAMFMRADLQYTEVQTLRGIIKSLVRYKPQNPQEPPE